MPVLQGVSLAVSPGQAVAIMGPTGAGKTTLALILAGLTPAMTGGQLRGRILVDGLDVTRTPAAQLSTHLGLVFQEPERQLFNMTVADEIAFGLEGLGMDPALIRARVAWALRCVGLEGLEERAPWQLSGGQQKRLAIGAILAMQPPVLVLDEPMAGLDPAGRREVADALHALRAHSGATAIVFEKDAEFAARWADRVAVLAEGKVVLDGPPQTVFQEVALLHRLGVAVPQAAELADRLRRRGWPVAFLTAREAAATLSTHLPSPSTGTLPPPTRAKIADRPPAVELRAVSFAYPNGTQALRDVSLSIPAGQTVALVGQNGSGKSTLARMLVGLLRPQRGSVLIGGRPTARRAVGELAREVGYVFQNPDHQIFAASAREEVAFGPRNLGLKGETLARRVQEALAAFGLEELADLPPAVMGYGVRRLVTLASVWAMQPAIWVLDEPTTGLDARHTAHLLERLRGLTAAGRTVLFITHDLRLAAELAERIVVLHCGRVALDGPSAEVLADADRLAPLGLRPPPIARLSAALAAFGFPHPTLTVDAFVDAWDVLMREERLEENRA